MHPLSERYSDLLGDGADPALIRLVEDLDRVCAPGPLPAPRDLTITRSIEERMAMQPTRARVRAPWPWPAAPRTQRATKAKSWLAVGWAALLPAVLLLALAVVLRNRQPTAIPRLGAVAHVAAGTPLSGATVKPGTWTVTGSLSQTRGTHAAALLADGRVLVAGGCQGACDTNPARASAELYDPRTGQWTMTGSMHDPRLQFTMTLLPSGQVLAIGGCRTADCSIILASAELYDPRTGTWTLTGSMHTPRVFGTATLLLDGRVLVAGGASNNSIAGITDTAEIYNPRTGGWTMTHVMGDVRGRHTATLLTNGKVLVAGGAQGTEGNDSGSPTKRAELYDPRTGKWSWTSSLNLAREAFTAVRLPSGEVLAASGWGPTTALTSAELYNPRSGTWSMTGSLHYPRNFEASEAAVLLRTGQVLVAGGHGNSPLASAELYSPRTGKWTLTGPMHLARGEQTTTLLANGEVLVASGSLNFSGSIGLAGAEIYYP
ncbi:MAG TPA: kelch repeat-containing protein [Chloroflexota bacterium]|nr:kelch repeat-containing protein [Chloroflexota bacterium]